MVVVESKFSDQLWLSFSLALAKPNSYQIVNKVKNVHGAKIKQWIR